MKLDTTIKSSIRILMVTLLGMAGLAASSATAQDYEEFWLTLKTPTVKLSDITKTKSYFHFQFRDGDNLNYFRVGQKFSHKLSDNWTLATNPLYEGSRNIGSSVWKRTYRLEIELNPAKIKLGENGPLWSMRNRWELRWKQGYGSEIFHRLRHESKLTWKLDGKTFNSYALGAEVFYETDKGMITGFYVYPAMLEAKLFNKVPTVFYLNYNPKRIGTSDNWTNTYIAGMDISF